MFGNWKPDYLQAAPYYDRAAAAYRAGGSEEQAKEMFLKAAECNVSCWVTREACGSSWCCSR
jgi:hypothetical protein